MKKDALEIKTLKQMARSGACPITKSKRVYFITCQGLAIGIAPEATTSQAKGIVLATPSEIPFIIAREWSSTVSKIKAPSLIVRASSSAPQPEA